MDMMFSARLRRFLADTRGNISVEAVIWMPLILTVLGGMFALHDSFRYKALNTKAAYTISDALSRETAPIDDNYLDGMVDVLEFLTVSEGPYSLRVSLVRFDADEAGSTTTSAAGGDYIVEWSQVRGDFDALKSSDLSTAASILPIMLDNERIILVETRTEYVPPFEIPGLNEADLFYTYGFTRPRFAPKIVWSGSSSS